jgi:hypothetical protein
MEEKIDKIIKVSPLFIEIYQNFNVIDQTEKMKSLTKKELYLLLTVCLDKFSDTDKTVKQNFLPFKEEVMDIFDVQDDKDTTIVELSELIEETGDKYIETDHIQDEAGNLLPDPLTKEEVRDKRIDIIGK